jgi:hypothetical protein
MVKYVATLALMALAISYPARPSLFEINNEPRNILTPLNELGISLTSSTIGKIPDVLRQPLCRGSAGDYYRSPMGAEIISLDAGEKEMIKKLLSENIKPQYYDSLVTSNITGYHYRFERQNEERREYFVRYAIADTVFVISGWLGKLFSFYIALPGWIDYDENQLQEIISDLTKNRIELEKMPDKKQISDPYFIEYVDRANMLRIRNYHVRELIEMGNVSQFSSRDRTLIEITRFLDKEATP